MTEPKPHQQRLRLPLQCLGLLFLLALCVILLWQAGLRFSETLYPLKYRALVEEAAAEYGIPPSLVYAVIHTESEFDPGAQSAAEAKGLMQLTDDTYRWALQRAGKEDTFDPNALYDPAVNIRYGVYVLSLLGEQFANTETVLAAYNAGQGHVREWLNDPAYSTDRESLSSIPFPETETYVQRVLAARKQYQVLYYLD